MRHRKGEAVIAAGQDKLKRLKKQKKKKSGQEVSLSHPALPSTPTSLPSLNHSAAKAIIKKKRKKHSRLTQLKLPIAFPRYI